MRPEIAQLLGDTQPLSAFTSFPPVKIPTSKLEILMGSPNLPPIGTTYGIEIEAEGIDEDRSWDAVNWMWAQKEDGSLRNGGREFVSAPLPFFALERALGNLFTCVPEIQFSHRCSIHVHVDVRSLTRAQAIALIVMYALTEPFFFAVAGPKRRQSNFCVGLEYTEDLDAMIRTCIDGHMAPDNLERYAALNILPAFGTMHESPRYGTMEFRHLYGTKDMEVLRLWLNMIRQLRESVERLSLDWLVAKVQWLNVDSTYLGVVERIFQAWTPQIMSHVKVTNLTRLLERHVTRVKQSLLYSESGDNLRKTGVQAGSPYDAALRKMYPNVFKPSGGVSKKKVFLSSEWTTQAEAQAMMALDLSPETQFSTSAWHSSVPVGVVSVDPESENNT